MVKSFLQTAFAVIVGLAVLGLAARIATQHAAPGTIGDLAKEIKQIQDNAYEWGENQIKFREEIIAERDAQIAELEERLEKCGCH